MLRRKKKSGGNDRGVVEIPAIDFKPPAADKDEVQGVLIACRALEHYPVAVTLLGQALDARAEQILMDFSKQGVAVRFRIDGIWENMPPMDRLTGDGVLVVFKRLCCVNAQDRRNRQTANLPMKYKGNDWILDFMSQGVPTGERVLLRIEPKKPVLTTLQDLGMREKMQAQLRSLLNSEESIFLFSGPAGHGLPTSWRVGLESADRFVRDFHAIQDGALQEPELINITAHQFDSGKGETPLTVLRSLLLKQPDVLVLPDFHNAEVAKLLCGEVANEHRYAITRVVAGSAVEGLLRLMATFKDSSKDLLKLTCGVLNQRLVRRLCPECRQPFQPSPQLLQKLGIPAGRVKVLYQPYIPPPPEQRVDANGKPIEIEICKKCNGRGFFGRAAIFELLTLNDAVRQAVKENPTPAHVTSVARQNGFLTIQEEGVLAVATGMTSLQELQRCLAPPKKK